MARGTTGKSDKTTGRHGHKQDSGKVGSDPKAAEHFAGKNDFGVPAEDARRFPSVSEEARNRPGGDHQTDPRPPIAIGRGVRDAGVGGNASGPGSSSGGDVDPDITGVGFGGTGISESGADARRDGADMTDGSPGAFAAAPPDSKDKRFVRGTNRAPSSPIGRGDTVDHSGGDASTTGSGEGSGVASPQFGNGDDAEAGEISLGEAGGEDNS